MSISSKYTSPWSAPVQHILGLTALPHLHENSIERSGVSIGPSVLLEVLKARKAWLEAAGEHGKPVPDPRYRPIIYQVA
jgi:hypothetical protein